MIGIIRLVVLMHTAFGESAATDQAVPLDALVRFAVERSPLIQAAAARVRAAHGDLTSAGALDNPEVEGGAGVKTQEGAGERKSGQAWELRATQRIPLPGRRSARRDEAQAAVRRADLALKRLTAETRAGTEVLAVRLLAAQKRAEIARSRSVRQRNAFSLIEGRPAGTPVIAVERETLRLGELRTRRELIAAEADVRQAWLALDRVVHLHRPDPSAVPEAVLAAVPELDLAAARRGVERQSLAVRESQADVDALVARARLARLAPWPDLAAGPFLERSSALDRESTVGAALSFPIPLLNRNQGGIITSAALLEAGRLDLQYAQHDAGHLAEALVARVQTARLRCAEAPFTRLAELEQEAAFVEEQLQLGRVSIQSFLTVDTELQEASLAVVEAHLEAVEATVALKLAAGLFEED